MRSGLRQVSFGLCQRVNCQTLDIEAGRMEQPSKSILILADQVCSLLSVCFDAHIQCVGSESQPDRDHPELDWLELHLQHPNRLSHGCWQVAYLGHGRWIGFSRNLSLAKYGTRNLLNRPRDQEMRLITNYFNKLPFSNCRQSTS